MDRRGQSGTVIPRRSGTIIPWCVTVQLGHQHRLLFCGTWDALARVAALLASGAIARLQPRPRVILERHVSDPASAADGVGRERVCAELGINRMSFLPSGIGWIGTSSVWSKMIL